MEKHISIIIPTYNMEAYIGKCLDSLLISEFDQVEVWVVNDGSKDRSSEIAHSYADRYPDSIHVLDKPNGNYGSCINAALPLCTGRYVKVLDADDTFDTAVFSQFVEKLRECEEDVVVTAFSIVDEKGNLKKIVSFEKYFRRSKSNVLNFKDALKSGFLNNPKMHAIAYHIGVFSRFNYKQTEGISFTDTEWASHPLTYCHSIRYLSGNPLYKYLLGREGQSVDPAKFEKQLNDYLKVFENRLQFIEKQNINADQKLFLNNFLIQNHCYIYAKNDHSTLALETIEAYDLRLKEKYPEFYEILGREGCYPLSNFRFIKQWRKSAYSPNMPLPLLTRIMISLRVRLFK